MINLFEPHARIVVNPGEAVGREAHAKQCARIAIDLILPVAQATDKYAPHWLKQEYPDQLGWEEYWQQVKQEIESL